jgi:ribosomal protein S18 acetylase RimI-like enzyme
VTSANLEGVAIWLPPEAAHGSLAKLLRASLFTLPLTAGPSFFLRFLSYHQHLDRLRREHTPFRHGYLQLLGVDPSHQRKGYATALVNPLLARFDREHATSPNSNENFALASPASTELSLRSLRWNCCSSR